MSYPRTLFSNRVLAGETTMKVRAHVFISGRVQGVFFRSRIRYEAIRHALTGWVRNLPDGRVEAVLEGEEEKVSAVIEFCRLGPPGAGVTNTVVKWENYGGRFTGFQIEY